MTEVASESSTTPDGELPALRLPARCYCYNCDQRTTACECEDCEFRCIECGSTSVECMEEDSSQSLGPPSSLSSRSARRDMRRQPRFAMRPRSSRPRFMSSRSRMADDSPNRFRINDELEQDARIPHQHVGVICDGCNVRDFSGTRYRCTTCADYDLCSACHERHDEIHPEHSFVAIQTPSRPLRTVSNISRGARQTLLAIIEVGMEALQERNALKETDVAWWLAQDQCLVDEEAMIERDPTWSCLICCEGLDALDENGWVVSICGKSVSRAQDGAACVSTDADGLAMNDGSDVQGSQCTLSQKGDADDKPKRTSSSSASHIFHEGCLRRWLMKNNSCPVCRRNPIIPENVATM